jgi:hypothetical protein
MLDRYIGKGIYKGVVENVRAVHPSLHPGYYVANIYGLCISALLCQELGIEHESSTTRLHW